MTKYNVIICFLRKMTVKVVKVLLGNVSFEECVKTLKNSKETNLSVRFSDEALMKEQALMLELCGYTCVSLGDDKNFIVLIYRADANIQESEFRNDKVARFCNAVFKNPIEAFHYYNFELSESSSQATIVDYCGLKAEFEEYKNKALELLQDDKIDEYLEFAAAFRTKVKIEFIKKFGRKDFDFEKYKSLI